MSTWSVSGEIVAGVAGFDGPELEGVLSVLEDELA